jgi:N6-adenosine-specific RNA methylase IME4/ParB-like chromosome segregation protein Spo0J
VNPFHPLADIFPLMEGDEFRDLVASIEKYGLREAVTVHEGMILDGRNRARACEKAGREPFYTLYRGDDPVAFVLDKNLHRRHLNESQRACVAAKLANMKSGERTDLAPIGARSISQDDAAKMLRVGRMSVTRAKRVQDKAVPELRDAVEGGHLTLAAAAQATCLDPAIQTTIAAEARKGHVNAARQVIKAQRRAQRERELGSVQCAQPTKKYGVIVADSEWRFEPWSRETGMDRAADNHYPTSCLDVIKARDVASIAADDCALFLWSTAPMLPQALEVITAWGFKYVARVVWFKQRTGDAHGTGYWFWNETEICLLGIQGNVPCPAPGNQWRDAIHAPVGEHSAKPEELLELVEAYFPNLPKIELNRRGPPRPGWDGWGNEAEPSNSETARADDLSIPEFLRRERAGDCGSTSCEQQGERTWQE